MDLTDREIAIVEQGTFEARFPVTIPAPGLDQLLFGLDVPTDLPVDRRLKLRGIRREILDRALQIREATGKAKRLQATLFEVSGRLDGDEVIAPGGRLDLEGRRMLAETALAGLALKVEQWLDEIDDYKTLFAAPVSAGPFWRRFFK